MNFCVHAFMHVCAGIDGRRTECINFKLKQRLILLRIEKVYGWLKKNCFAVQLLRWISSDNTFPEPETCFSFNHFKSIMDFLPFYSR